MSEKIKNFFASERAKLKGMSFKEKAAYVWEYYKIPIIAVIVVAIIIGSIINSVWINPEKKMYLQFAFFGGYADDSAAASMCGQLEAALMTPDEQEKLQISSASFMTDSGDPQMDMAYQEKFASMISVRELDLLVVDDADLDSMVSQGILAPVKDYLPDGLLPKVSGSLIESADENGAKDDYAIKLDGNTFFGNSGLLTDGMCIGVVVNTQNPDRVKGALDYIFKI